MYIILIFPRYVSCISLSTSRLSPSMYKFSVVSKFLLSALHGLNVLDIGAFAVRIDCFLSGHVNWYLSSLPSTTFDDISCIRTSLSIAFSISPFSFITSVTAFGNSSCSFLNLSSARLCVCMFNFSIIILLNL